MGFRGFYVENLSQSRKYQIVSSFASKGQEVYWTFAWPWLQTELVPPGLSSQQAALAAQGAALAQQVRRQLAQARIALATACTS